MAGPVSSNRVSNRSAIGRILSAVLAESMAVFFLPLAVMPMTALVLIVSGCLIIVTSLFMMCYCMARLRTQLKRALEEERALRARKHESGSEGPYSEFVDTYGSMMPPRQQPFSSSVFQSGDQAGLRSRRLSSMPGRAVSY
ncbi:uncharacterized protein LOC144142366 [Haemaphysalis longicornis]